MVSNASDDFPDPLGPVTTVNLPSGRSTSTPLRLFWRAPRISTQPRSNGAVTHSFSASFELTGDYPSGTRRSQIPRSRGCLARRVPRLAGHGRRIIHALEVFGESARNSGREVRAPRKKLAAIL